MTTTELAEFKKIALLTAQNICKDFTGVNAEQITTEAEKIYQWLIRL
jgi:hypothetical protein